MFWEVLKRKYFFGKKELGIFLRQFFWEIEKKNIFRIFGFLILFFFQTNIKKISKKHFFSKIFKEIFFQKNFQEKKIFQKFSKKSFFQKVSKKTFF